MNETEKRIAKESGRRVKNAARRKGITQAALAKDSNLSVSAIQSIYLGDRKLQDYQAEDLAKILDVRKEYLLCLDDDITDEARKNRLFAESVEHALSISKYQNQLLSDACNTASYEFTGVIVDSKTADFRYRITASDKQQFDFSPDEIDTWMNDCLKYAAFCLSLLIQKRMEDKHSNGGRN